MANIVFTSKEAFVRFHDQSKRTHNLGTNSLDNCMLTLLHWFPWDATIRISCDFEGNSFSFREELSDGRTGVVGGIIYHGPHDGFGSGSAPTFAVTLDNTIGYSIHT